MCSACSACLAFADSDDSIDGSGTDGDSSDDNSDDNSVDRGEKETRKHGKRENGCAAVTQLPLNLLSLIWGKENKKQYIPCALYLRLSPSTS